MIGELSYAQVNLRPNLLAGESTRSVEVRPFLDPGSYVHVPRPPPVRSHRSLDHAPCRRVYSLGRGWSPARIPVFTPALATPNGRNLIPAMSPLVKSSGLHLYQFLSCFPNCPVTGGPFGSRCRPPVQVSLVSASSVSRRKQRGSKLELGHPCHPNRCYAPSAFRQGWSSGPVRRIRFCSLSPD